MWDEEGRETEGKNMENAAARPLAQPSPMGVVSALFAAFLRPPVAVLPLLTQYGTFATVADKLHIVRSRYFCHFEWLYS